MVDVTQPSPQVSLFTVVVDGREVEVRYSIEGLKWFKQIVDKLDDHETRLDAGGL